MGTKYSTVTVSGYNASPPPDDGSIAASNQLAWSKHTGKIGDPLKTAIDSINSKLVTALDESSRQITSNDTLIAGDHNRTIQIASTISPGITVTLADAATMAAGYVVNVINLSAVHPCTIARATGADTINGVASNLTLYPNTSHGFVVNAAADGYNLIDSSTYFFLQSGTGAAKRTAQDKIREIVSVTDFGTIGDGVTDDYTPWTNALAAAAGRMLFVPNGTYRINLSTPGRTLTPSAGTKICFESRSAVLDVVATGMTTGTRNVFTASADGVEIRGGKINVSSVADASSSVVIVSLDGGSNWLIEGQEHDGNVAYSGAFNWNAHVCKLGAGGFTNFLMMGCYCHELNRVYFRESSESSTVRGLKFLFNRYEDLFRAAISLNSPNGITEDVLIHGNSSKDNDSRTTGGADHFHFGLGSSRRVRCLGNDIKGTGNGIHIEEAADHIVVSNNTIILDDAAALGVNILDNNISGGPVTPKNVIIEANTIEGPGTGSSNQYGIYTVNDASGAPPIDNITVKNNVVSGFLVGIRFDDEFNAIVCEGNLVRNCVTGIVSLGDALPGVRNNYLQSCTTGLNSTNELGYWGPNHLTSVTNQIIANAKNFAAPLDRASYTDHYEWFDDFVGDQIDDRWTLLSGTDPQATQSILTSLGTGGRIRLTTGDDAAASMAVNGTQIKGARHVRPNMGDLVFEWRGVFNNITDVCFFIGLTDDETNLEMPFTLGAGDALTPAADDAVGVLFDTAADTDNWWLVGVAATTPATHQNAGIAPVSNQMETWRIEITGAGVAAFYHNGVQIGNAMTGAVTASAFLCPVIASFSRVGTSKEIDTDYIFTRARRATT